MRHGKTLHCSCRNRRRQEHLPAPEVKWSASVYNCGCTVTAMSTLKRRNMDHCHTTTHSRVPGTPGAVAAVALEGCCEHSRAPPGD
ncbi:uncharacterized protein LOC124117287 isoform X2 [Haliotis rufescens]|uniref:uncharacterized protein LOC124117287 isoform X2 n=1 Tax=Haliotis rufescens TaxID=6454 RepID=UPI00201E856E|nr:uncharacterized protein LOC124117287 isoform X2 [Haliotis rufescens]